MKDASPVRRGAVGKGLRELHLAGRLPYCTPGACGRCGIGSGRVVCDYHPAYDLGMPRLSCCFCILRRARHSCWRASTTPNCSPTTSLWKRRSVTASPGTAAAEVQRALEEGEEPGPIHDWIM